MPMTSFIVWHYSDNYLHVILVSKGSVFPFLISEYRLVVCRTFQTVALCSFVMYTVVYLHIEIAA